MSIIQLKICGMENDGYGNVHNTFRVESSENYGFGGVYTPDKVPSRTEWDPKGTDRLGRATGAAYYVPNFELIDQRVREFLDSYPGATVFKSTRFEMEEKKYR